MHPPTPQDRRVAAIRYQAERMLQDAAAWGLVVSIDALHAASGAAVYNIDIRPHAHEPEAPPTPIFSPAAPARICVGPGRCPHDATAPGPLPEPCRVCGGRDPLPF